jgi:hypothetical protein
LNYAFFQGVPGALHIQGRTLLRRLAAPRGRMRVLHMGGVSVEVSGGGHRGRRLGPGVVVRPRKSFRRRRLNITGTLNCMKHT